MFGNLIILAFLTILSPNDQKNIHDRWDNELKKYVSDYGKVNHKKWNASTFRLSYFDLCCRPLD